MLEAPKTPATEAGDAKAIWKTGAGDNGSKGGSSKKGVNTGDENTLGAWIVLLAAALAGTTGMVFARKRRND